MPSDIRSFFGGGGGGGSSKTTDAPAKKTQVESKPTKKARGRKVVSDDEDEEEEPQPKSKKSTPVKPRKSVKEDKVEETTSSAYFASSKEKAAKPATGRSKKAASTNGVTKTPTKNINGSGPSPGRRSARKSAVTSYAEDDDEMKILDDQDGGDDDIFANDFAKTARNDDDYEEGSDEEVLPSRPKRPEIKDKKISKVELDDEEIEAAPILAYDGSKEPRGKTAKAAPSRGRKRKSKDLAEDDDTAMDDDEDDEPKKKTRKPTAKSTPNPKPRAAPKTEEKEESKEIQDIMDNIPLVRAPTPPPRDENRKFTFGGGNANVAPMAAGSKDIPTGEENCLAGLTFVFTGVLESLGREEGQNLVKQYGGKVTTGPSSKTSFVVLGADAGPKKLETIKKLELKTINEDGLFQLIKTLPPNGGDSKAAEKHAEKKAKEDERIRREAEEMEKKDKERRKEQAKAAAANSSAPASSVKPTKPRMDSRLWVDKYAPDSITAVCGNKTQVEGLQNWLRNWHKRAKHNFKQAGPDGKGVFRAAMIHGPPGIGKTTAAHLVAKLEGFDVVESNASDTRSKKLVEAGLTGVLDTTSLLGYFSGDGKKVDAEKRKLVLIMDEVDGMSAGDRGGVGALAAVAKKTRIPMILICNERRLPKMKPFDFVTADFGFRRPTTDMIRGRIATICFREGLKLPQQVLNAIIEGTNADIRQIINMISTIKLDNKDMDFSDSKAMSKAWEKHIILKPWDIVGKILRPQMFAASSTATLNDKIELYFNDHEFSYLMLQENYLKTQPAAANSYSGRERNLKLLELASNAADSISDGDLVDRMIHGSQQQWSLMPTHAVFSFVKPASLMYGNFGQQVQFASWLGMNSKQGKLSRFVKEIQGHMRLRSSGDRHEVRQQYLPAIWNKTVKVLRDDGKEAVQDVIDFMDSYYLTKDDFDAMIELGVGPMDQEHLKLESTTKAAFTRLYNQQSHPMPFIKASAVSNAAARIGAGIKRDKPDLEEAIEDDEVEGADEGALDPEAKDELDGGDDEVDLKKDKYIKAPKKKAAGKGGASSKAEKGGAKGKGKGKRTKDDDEEDESDEEPKPKKGKGGAGKGKTKGKA